MSKTQEPQKAGVANKILGALIIGVALAANPWVLGSLLSADGNIESSGARLVIFAAEGLLLLFGLLILKGGPRMRRRLLLGILALVMCLVPAEILLRIIGQGPWSPAPLDVKVTPNGKFFEKHSRLGYVQIPGQFKVTLNGNYDFTVTHGSDTLRATRPADATPPADAKSLWIFGCSITHGWSLSDEDTYSWKVQEALPQWNVRNFGVQGYGTLHSLIQFRSEREAGRSPQVAVVAYGSLHDERNTFARSRRKAIAPWNRLGPLLQPFARLSGEVGITIGMADVVYKPFPLQGVSAVAHFVEQIYNQVEHRRLKSNEVSRRILRTFAQECSEAHIPFVVAGITDDDLTEETLAWCRALDIMAVDISVDLEAEGGRNLPHDNHPSARSNRTYAERLVAFLRERRLL